MGMEHGNSIKGIEGERAVIEAYRAIDPRRRSAPSIRAVDPQT